MRHTTDTSVPLRRRLLVLVAAGILPLALMSGLGLYVLARQQRAQVERVGVELARAVATAVDAELRANIAVLESLANQADDLANLRSRALRVLETQPNWVAVTLATPVGVRVFDTRYPPDAAPGPPVGDRDSFDRAVRTSAAAVGNLDATVDGPLVFRVRVPIVRQNQLRFILTAVVKPEQIRDVVIRQGAPADWVISIFDASGRRVARSRAHAETLGGQASPTLRELMARSGREGFDVTKTLEGDRTYTPYTRIDPIGWTAALGIPTALAEAAGYRSLAVYGGGVLLSILLGTYAALRVARSISRPIADLRDAAQALGRREPLRAPETPIQEIRDVAAALLAAADERTKSESYREELLSKERAARAAAEAADRTKDEFLAVLSHELRTPLNAVYGWARMLGTGQLHGDEIARAVDAIERNANAQVQLVDDLLDVSRIVTGKMRLDVRAVDLPPVVEAALDAVRPAAEAKGIRLQSVLDSRAGPVMGDPARLQQTVWNLLINAVKFTGKGGRVQVHLLRINSHVEITVSDSGEGIAPDVLPFVFERFRQADSSSTRAHAGLGLGLALVKHLVELHGGSVKAQSAGKDMGSTFTVTLPLPISMPAGPTSRIHPTATSSDDVPAGTRLDGLRVLVVDDDADALELAATILETAGARIRRCAAAPEAFDALREWRPDVVISDIEMPGEDGYALIRKVRALDASEGGKTPAIALTAYGRVQDRMLSLAAGYNMHVPKPVDPGELTMIVASVAGRPAGPATP